MQLLWQAFVLRTQLLASWIPGARGSGIVSRTTHYYVTLPYKKSKIMPITLANQQVKNYVEIWQRNFDIPDDLLCYILNVNIE